MAHRNEAATAPAESPASPPGRRRGVGPSPLTARILAVNLIAPMLLLVGLLYLDQYEKALIQAELAALKVQAELIAAAVGEGAVSAETATFENSRVPVTSHRLVPEQARSMVRRLAGLGGVRARLFDGNGLLVADSRRLLGPGGAVQVVDLEPPAPSTLQGWLKQGYDWFARMLRVNEPLPTYRERKDQTASDYDELIEALEIGTPATMVRRYDRDRRILSAAVPVTYYKQVVGGVMVSDDDDVVQTTLFEVRLDIFKLFLATLGVTVLLSIYLAQAIARPVRRLALAAERVRHGHGRRVVIPDLSRRRDEIGELSTSLREMTDALWQRMDATERFAADVAHEIKNPLTSLRSAVETVARVSDPEKQKRLLAILQDDVARLDRLISDISDASRLDAELSRAEQNVVALAPMLETLADVYGPAGEERGVGLRVVLPGVDRLEVRGLEDRLVQVLRNLIGNALSFSPKGGAILLRGWIDDGRVAVSVEDDGPGIPAGKEKAIFDRFYTERPQGEKFGAHSGLGLSISKQIVEAHGGTIRAENRTGENGAVLGARFVLSLPRAE